MKRFKTVLNAVLAFLPIVYTSVAVLFFLPEKVAAHFDIHGQVDRYGSKYEAFLLPAIILIMYLIVMIIRKFTLKSSTDDDKTRRNIDVGDTVVLLILILMDAFDAMILFMMANPKVITDPESVAICIISVIVGIAFILIGNIMPKTKPNAFIGMRLRFCMDTDEHWYIANRAGGIAMVFAGLSTIIAGLLLRNIGYVFVMVISLIVFLTVAILYSYVKIKKK